MSVVSNTGPLIALAKINRLELLEQLFIQVEIPPAVHRELFASNKPESARLERALSSFIHTAPSFLIPPEVQTATSNLGEGEQQAIALAIERKGLLLIDDRAARTAARQLGVTVTGTVGVLIRAKEHSLIAQVLPLLEELRERGYWFSDEMLVLAAKLAGEQAK